MVWGVRSVPSVTCICSLTLCSGLLGRVSLCVLGWRWASWHHQPRRQVGYVFYLSADSHWYE